MNPAHVENGQHWILVGTAPASEEVWGIHRIAFPCGYNLPSCSFARPEQGIRRPDSEAGFWVMGGFAFEVATKGKEVDSDRAVGLVAGYRPWLALFRNALLDELTERKHTITVWDMGVSIFYGLWREAGQVLGDIITVESHQRLAQYPLRLRAENANCTGASASQYAHQASDIIIFMSQFMTLSPGDIYILGPLAAQWIETEIDHLAMDVGDFSFETAVQ